MTKTKKLKKARVKVKEANKRKANSIKPNKNLDRLIVEAVEKTYKRRKPYAVPERVITSNKKRNLLVKKILILGLSFKSKEPKEVSLKDLSNKLYSYADLRIIRYSNKILEVGFGSKVRLRRVNGSIGDKPNTFKELEFYIPE